MKYPDAVKTESWGGNTPSPLNAPLPPRPPGAHGESSPEGSFGWQLWTLQNVAILVFMALALAAILISFYIIVVPASQAGEAGGLATQVVNTLLVAIGMTLVFAWLSSANAQMIGRGFRYLLSFHRAAVANFIISGAATVGILIYVTLAIIAAAELEHGLYLPAAIELLLKLTAVSAIIVLITLRRATTTVLPQRPLVRVDDDIATQIATAIQNSPAMRDLTGNMTNAQRDALSNSIEAGISSVIYNTVDER